MGTLKSNIIFKGILTFSNYIIGFITFPYVTRILGPDKFGLVNFALNTVDYFLLFATLGITTIGTREIARTKFVKDELEKSFSNIFGLNAISTFFVLIIFTICVLLIPRFREISELLYIGSAKILFAFLAIEWLYTGLEEFKYITIRSLSIKVIYVISVFIFIKQPSDYILFFILTVAGVVINSAVNFLYSFRFISILPKELFSGKYLKQNLKLGGYAIMTSMYMTFNVMYLGLVSSNDEVGFYSSAVKLYFVAISLFGSYTSVMLPRVSSLLSSGNQVQVNKYLIFSFRLVIAASVPIILIGIFYAPQIIEILSGKGYENAIILMRITMPALIFVWSAFVIVYQVLIPTQQDNIVLRASVYGGIIAILLNILLTTQYGALGTTIVLLSCEIFVTSYYLLRIYQSKILVIPPFKKIMGTLISSLPYILFCCVTKYFFNNYWGLILSILFCSGYFLLRTPTKGLLKKL